MSEREYRRVLLLEELAGCSVEVVFLNYAIGATVRHPRSNCCCKCRA
jgi:hypothetical protein